MAKLKFFQKLIYTSAEKHFSAFSRFASGLINEWICSVTPFGVFLFTAGIMIFSGNPVVANPGPGNGLDTTKVSTPGFFDRISGIGEGVIDRITWEWEETVFTVYPVIGLNPRSGFVYGVMPALKWDSYEAGKTNTLTVNAEASTQGMKQLQVEHEWYLNSEWLFRGKVLINEREDQFWPEGSSDGVYFNRREERLDWYLLRSLTPSLMGGVEILWGRNDFSDSPFPANVGMDGKKGGVVAGMGPALVFDNRERTLAPSRGNFIELAWLFAGAGDLGNYRYDRLTLDARRYWSKRENGTVWAFQSILDFAEGNVPFYEEPQLGGKERLRGVGHPLRQTGGNTWLIRGEIRQPVWWRIGAVFFAGMGKASNDFENPFKDVTGSFGTGLRFRILPDDPLNVRLDFGVSTLKTNGFYISLKEAF